METWTAPESGWYETGAGEPRKLSDAEVRAVMADQVAGREAIPMARIRAGDALPPPPAELTPEQAAVAWLRRQIEARLYLARRAIELGSSPEWHEQSSGVLITSERDDWEGLQALGDSSLARLMEANDPQDTIARCESELAVLGEHYILHKDDRNEAYEEFGVCTMPGDSDHGCVTCHYKGYGGVNGYGICRTVRAVALAYRHHAGYAEHWGDVASRA